MTAKTFASLSNPELLRMIKAGAIGVLPTDTVYGLVAQANNDQALERFYKAKQRGNEPGTIIGASVDQFVAMGFPADALKLAARYWPETVSVVIDASDVAHMLKQHRSSLALRIPAPRELRSLLDKSGPLMTTSANPPGEPIAHTIEEAKEYFGDTIDFYVGTNYIDYSSSTIVGIDAEGNTTTYRQGSAIIQ